MFAAAGQAMSNFFGSGESATDEENEVRRRPS